MRQANAKAGSSNWTYCLATPIMSRSSETGHLWESTRLVTRWHCPNPSFPGSHTSHLPELSVILDTEVLVCNTCLAVSNSSLLWHSSCSKRIYPQDCRPLAVAMIMSESLHIKTNFLWDNTVSLGVVTNSTLSSHYTWGPMEYTFTSGSTHGKSTL